MIINPKCIPTNPPGYYFVTNSRTFDFKTKIANDEQNLTKKISENFAQIPETAFITLKNDFGGFSTFVEEQYKNIIDSWIKGIEEMIELLSDASSRQIRNQQKD